MSLEGILACITVTVSVGGEAFTEFAENSVMPNLMLFNGYNPRSVLVMDKCSIHHIQEASELIQQTGIIQWLPPYSPDMNQPSQRQNPL